ncbi:MAG: cyclic nucleotide-binding domain-containing protein [Actinomycetes bacterium]
MATDSPDLGPASSEMSHAERDGRSTAGTAELVSFLLPFLRPVRRPLVTALALGMTSVVAGVLIPLQIHTALLEGALEHGEHKVTENAPLALAIIAGLMAISVVTASMSRKRAHECGADVGQELSEYVFEHTLETPMLRQVGLRRPSVISRNTTDVDRIGEIVDISVAEGLPAITGIVLSLTLLIYIQPYAGVATLTVTLFFLFFNGRIGRNMLKRDRARLDSSSDVGAVVDESITAGRNLTGMNLTAWMRERFHARAEILRHATEHQRNEINRLLTMARFSGYVALFAVVVIAVFSGNSQAGAIAAALLYIEMVVTGLESLPPWLRELRLAVTSKRRIEQITTSGPRVSRGETGVEVDADHSFRLRNLALMPGNPITVGDVLLPLGGVIGVVNDMGVSANILTEILSGDSDPDSGVVLLDGVDVRHPSVKRRIVLVTDDPYLMDASVREHLNSAKPNLTDDEVHATLDMVGIAHLTQLPDGGIDARLGTHAGLLSVHERQRLMLAMAAIGDADVVVIQDLPALADPDGAAPLLAALATKQGRTVILTTANAEFAARVDHVIAPIGAQIVSGTHQQLMENHAYAAVWERQVAGGIDARILETIPQAQRDTLRSRLITEHFRAGDTLFRAGSPADRIMYVVTGRVSIFNDDGGVERRVADIGPGNFCGDVSQPGSRHSDTVRAADDTMVRTLSVEAWSAGVLGLLDSDPGERLVIAHILRADQAPTVDLLPEQVIGLTPEEVTKAVDALMARGQLRQDDRGRLSITARRRTLSGSSALLDRLDSLDF